MVQERAKLYRTVIASNRRKHRPAASRPVGEAAAAAARRGRPASRVAPLMDIDGDGATN